MGNNFYRILGSLLMALSAILHTSERMAVITTFLIGAAPSYPGYMNFLRRVG